jgi:cellulose synthase/poly-beta-1,6-N-acetylglucosamine synthase-like glycosyltransferase
MFFSPLFLVTVAFSELYFVMVVYFFVGWLRLKKTGDTKHKTTDNAQPFVSVVIPTRNESTNIQACLESIFKQNYPKDLFEVIVVDDYSTDPTLRLARESNEKNILVLDLMQYLGNAGEYSPNKKKALALGIKNAKGDLIITTDGDCTMNENWLSAMVNHYQQSGKKLITGPVMIQPARNPFAWFQQLDVMNLSAIGGATMRNGFPTMCNGANLMYAKQTFIDVEGFKGNHDVPTGDDVFLMQKISERFPDSIGYVKDFDACVFTKAEKGLGGFISQRTRWVSKSTGFSDWKVTLTLYFAYLFNALIVAAICFTFPLSELSWLPLAVIGGTKLLADLLFNVPVTIFFRKWYMLLLLPLTEVFHVVYVLLIGPLSLLGRYRWKDRKIR